MTAIAGNLLLLRLQLAPIAVLIQSRSPPSHPRLDQQKNQHGNVTINARAQSAGVSTGQELPHGILPMKAKPDCFLCVHPHASMVLLGFASEFRFSHEHQTPKVCIIRFREPLLVPLKNMNMWWITWGTCQSPFFECFGRSFQDIGDVHGL